MQFWGAYIQTIATPDEENSQIPEFGVTKHESHCLLHFAQTSLKLHQSSDFFPSARDLQTFLQTNTLSVKTFNWSLVGRH